VPDKIELKWNSVSLVPNEIIFSARILNSMRIKKL